MYKKNKKKEHKNSAAQKLSRKGKTKNRNRETTREPIDKVLAYIINK